MATPLVAQAEDGEGEQQPQVAAQALGEVRVRFVSNFSSVDRHWEVSAATDDDLIDFGRWLVNSDPSPSAAPGDVIATNISRGDVRCGVPRAYLRDAPTPPLFLAGPTPVPELVSTAELAATQVWTKVYGCFQEFPEFTSFQGRPGLEGKWIVEGKAATSQYGLWEVDAATGDITPLDDIARKVDAVRQPKESCNPPDVKPAVVTGQEASIRVWAAVYDCFTRPPLAAFTARQEDPEQWVVEGRTDTVDPDTGAITSAFYGLWLVNTKTGKVTAHDDAARAVDPPDNCFKPLPPAS